MAFALAALIPSHAAIVETKRWIPAKAVDSWGHELTRDILVTIFYEDSVDAPRPLAIVNHGRGTARERKALGQAAYRDISRWLVKRGFLVAVPTRIGYGVTGGPDIEETGSCGNTSYASAYAASAAQTMTVIDYLSGWEEVDKDRIAVLGLSAGGTTAIAIAAMDRPGVKAAINFAGGGGGRPKSHPGEPCSPQAMTRLFADYGKTARIPTMWIYSENDEYFGAKLPRQWFEAFRAAGGKGEFVALPPYPGGGHGIFTKAPEWWQPKVEAFLAPLSGGRGRDVPRHDVNPRARPG